MRWLVLDVTLCLLALAVLAVVLRGLWRRVKELGAVVAASSAAIGTASEALAGQLAEAQAAAPAGSPTGSVHRDAIDE